MDQTHEDRLLAEQQELFTEDSSLVILRLKLHRGFFQLSIQFPGKPFGLCNLLPQYSHPTLVFMRLGYAASNPGFQLFALNIMILVTEAGSITSVSYSAWDRATSSFWPTQSWIF